MPPKECALCQIVCLILQNPRSEALILSIRWLWILLAAFLGELVGIVVLMGIRLLHGYSPVEITPLTALGRSAFLLELGGMMALCGWWVASRKAHRYRVLHGLFVGLTAVLLYEIVTFRQPIPVNLQYLLAHAVKVCGGVIGGWLAARQHAQRIEASARIVRT